MNKDGYKTVPQLEQKLEKMEDATRDVSRHPVYLEDNPTDSSQVHDSDDDLSDGEVRRQRERRREHRESNLAKLDELLGDAEEREAREKRTEEHHAASGVWGALHGKSPKEQMLSPWFILITLLTVLQMLRMNFFIATIRSQYEYMLGSIDAGRAINTFFDVALPVSFD